MNIRSTQSGNAEGTHTDFGTEWVHGGRVEEELSRSEGTCAMSPPAPPLSQVVRSGSPSAFVPPVASGGFVVSSVSFAYFSQRGLGAVHAGLCTSACIGLVLLLCLKVRISVWLTLTPVSVLLDTNSTGCA